MIKVEEITDNDSKGFHQIAYFAKKLSSGGEVFIKYKITIRYFEHESGKTKIISFSPINIKSSGCVSDFNHTVVHLENDKYIDNFLNNVFWDEEEAKKDLERQIFEYNNKEMHITDLIKKLKHYKDIYGNIPVMVESEKGVIKILKDVDLDSSDIRETAILILKS